MNLGTLKNIFKEHNIKQIAVKFPADEGGATYYVLNAVFDKRSRNTVFLDVSLLPVPRNNRTQIIKNYITDFNDSHEVKIRDNNKNAYPVSLSNDIYFDKDTGILFINTAKRL